MIWHTQRMALLDFETTGVDAFRDRIVTAALIGAGGKDQTSSRTWTINPGIPIPAAATEVHGISTEQAIAEGSDPATAVVEIAKAVIFRSRSRQPIVGHNIVYDLTMLWAELTRHGQTRLAQDVANLKPVVDTQIIEKSLDPYRPKVPKSWTKRPADSCGSHTLVECCRLWDVALSEEDAHGAEADALAAGRLAWRLAYNPHRFAQFDTRPLDRIDPGRMDLKDLHAWQVAEYARSTASFQSYMRGEQKAKPDEVDPEFVARTGWPVQEPPADWSPEQLPAVPEAVGAR